MKNLFAVALLCCTSAFAAPDNCATRAAAIKDPQDRAQFYRRCVDRVRDDMSRFYQVPYAEPRGAGPAYDGSAAYDKAWREQGGGLPRYYRTPVK